VDKLRTGQNNTEYRNIRNWISQSDFPAQQSDFLKKRQKGTGQWFLDSTQVKRWHQDPNATLFCPGTPGAGKSMIAAIAIEDLLKGQPIAIIGVAYVYCSYK